MLTTTTFKNAFVTACMFSSLFLMSCQKSADDNMDSNSNTRLQVRLTDSPNPDISQVWIDVQEVRINYTDTNWITLSGAHPGLYQG